MWRKTITKRFCATLAAIRVRLRKVRHWKIREQGAWLRRVSWGWMNYHSIPGNFDRVEQFRTQVRRHWIAALRARSQRHRMPWSRFAKIAERHLPRPKVLHPWPSERFYAKHPR